MTRRRLALLLTATAVAACATPKTYSIEAWITQGQYWWRFPEWDMLSETEACIAAERLTKYYHRAHRVVRGSVEVCRYGQLEEWP